MGRIVGSKRVHTPGTSARLAALDAFGDKGDGGDESRFGLGLAPPGF